MNLDAKALSGFIKEIEDSRDRQKGETDFQRDVFKRAKEKHFDTKAMRIVLQRRAMDAGARDEQDYNVQAYELALGNKKKAIEALEGGASVRDAAAYADISVGATAALRAGVQDSSFVNTEEGGDHEPGRPVIDSEEGGDCQSASRGGEESAASNTASASSPPPIAEYVFPYSQAELEAEYPGITAPDRDPSLPPEPDLTIPPFLRRTAA